MKDMLDRLIELQVSDISVVACQKEEEQLPRDLELRENKIRALTAQVREQEEEAERISAQVKEIEKQLDEVREMVRRSQARLLLVKTQREHQAVQRESEFARKRKGELELQAREALTEKEATDSALKDLKAQVAEENRQFEEEKSKAGTRLKKLAVERQQLEKNREVAAGLIEKDILHKYEKIFRRYRGQAVVQVVKGVCKGCFMTVPPQLFNQVLAKDRIHTCPNCGRIIYVEET